MEARRSKGRKRHLLVDTEGLVLKAKVHVAKAWWISRGSSRCSMVPRSCSRAFGTCGWTRWLQGQRERHRLGAEDVRMECATDRTSAQTRPRRSADELGGAIGQGRQDSRGWQKLLPPRAFQVLPRRWVVERSFAWISHNRRMSLGTKRSCVQPARRSCTLP